MSSWQTMWSFKTANFRVDWSIAPEDNPDFSFDDSGETADKIELGLWYCFTSRIRVTHIDTGAVLGEDFLGNSIYADPADFRDHVGARGKYGSYFRDMVGAAVGEARSSIRKIGSTYVRED